MVLGRAAEKGLDIRLDGKKLNQRQLCMSGWSGLRGRKFAENTISSMRVHGGKWKG